MNLKDTNTILDWLKDDLPHLHYEESRRLNDLIWKGKPSVHLNFTVPKDQLYPQPWRDRIKIIPEPKRPARRLTGWKAFPFYGKPVAILFFLGFLAVLVYWVATHSVH